MRTSRVAVFLLLVLLSVGCRKQNGANGPTQTPPARPAEGAASTTAAAGTEAPTGTEPERPADAVARVDSTFVSRSELEDRIRMLTSGRKLDAASVERLRRKALDELVERRLVEQAASQDGLTVSEEEIDALMKQSMDTRGGPEKFAAFLQKQGMTEDGWRAENRFTALRKKLRDARFPVAVSEEEVTAYFGKYSQAGSKGEKVRVSRIFLPIAADAADAQWKEAEQTLTSIRSEIEAGLSFEDAAKRSSKCPYAKKGGDMGFATRARRPEDVFSPAFGMKVGEIAGPMRTAKGVQLLKVTDRTEEKVGTFEQEKENIRKVLEGQARQRNTRKLVDQLQKQYRVEYFL